MNALYRCTGRQALLGLVAAAFLFCAALANPLAQQPPAASEPATTQGRSGGEVYSAPGAVAAPVPVFKPEPTYSEEARRARFQGTIVLLLVVDASGNVTDVRVVRPLGMGLDEKAIETVRTWRFKPATRNGAPVPVRIMVEVSFHLSGRCRLPFSYGEMDGDDPGQIAWGRFPEGALSWWEDKDGAAKFPLVCPTDHWSAKYAIIWRRSSPSKAMRAEVYGMGAKGENQSPALFTSKETKSAQQAFQAAIKYLNGEATRAH